MRGQVYITPRDEALAIQQRITPLLNAQKGVALRHYYIKYNGELVVINSHTGFVLNKRTLPDYKTFYKLYLRQDRRVSLAKAGYVYVEFDATMPYLYIETFKEMVAYQSDAFRTLLRLSDKVQKTLFDILIVEAYNDDAPVYSTAVTLDRAHVKVRFVTHTGMPLSI